VARPKFYVKHLVACSNAVWDGPAGPDTARTLEGVNYLHRVPPDTEFPFEQSELWLHARFVRTNDVAGERNLTLELWWLDAPDGETRVFADTVGPVRFAQDRPVAARAWVIRPLMLPGEGAYEFRLLDKRWRSWDKSPRLIANEFLRVVRSA
jgi:hypothetical protein